jgi:hypothetical protein
VIRNDNPNVKKISAAQVVFGGGRFENKVRFRALLRSRILSGDIPSESGVYKPDGGLFQVEFNELLRRYSFDALFFSLSSALRKLVSVQGPASHFS